MGIAGEKGDGRGVLVFRRDGVSVKRRDRNLQTADVGKGQWFAGEFMGELLSREDSYPVRFAKEFRWKILAAAFTGIPQSGNEVPNYRVTDK